MREFGPIPATASARKAAPEFAVQLRKFPAASRAEQFTLFAVVKPVIVHEIIWLVSARPRALPSAPEAVDEVAPTVMLTVDSVFWPASTEPPTPTRARTENSAVRAFLRGDVLVMGHSPVAIKTRERAILATSAGSDGDGKAR